MAAARPVISIQAKDGKNTSVVRPHVFSSPIRSDLVQFVSTQMRKNNRQPYAVNENSGAQTSAESWGTGRAVARIPRVSGGGTSRSGQGAFGNMCRKGRMFAPTKIWRRWHRRINKNQRRYAVCSAIAATAEPALVLARGHRVSNVPEIPLVVATADVSTIAKTKDAVALLKRVGAYSDVERVISSRHVRSGKGKMRNRRYVQRRGPLVVYQTEGTLVRAFRNIPGIDLVNVHKLNLLQLAPGGHLGRFVIWTEDAFKQLDHVFGSHAHESLEKSGYKPPRPIMANPDLGRIINSSSVQEVLRDTQSRRKFTPRKKNPLVNTGALVKLNPYALAQRRRAISLAKLGAKRAAANLATRKSGKPTKASAARKTERAAAKAMAKKRSQIISLITGVKH